MTRHEIIVGTSSDMSVIATGSVDLIVTSPPYPMISMWDAVFCEQDPAVGEALLGGDGMEAFRKMHRILDGTWKECDRVLAENGFVCINIGDATRTIRDEFRLYPNHARIIQTFMEMGYSVLPDIHWRKPSNAPNKFMGSGMYPAGAYVTYEHEYILVFRKGGKRHFNGAERLVRQKSAYFWEERNEWFSDLWDIRGTSQTHAGTLPGRERNASYPLEIPYRLVNMYSVEGDTVLDPFAGLGTTGLACMIANRNSIGYDIDAEIARAALSNMDRGVDVLNAVIDSRLKRHLEFLEGLSDEERSRCYRNTHYAFDVKTKQETAIKIDRLCQIRKTKSGFICRYDNSDSLQDGDFNT